MSPKPAARRRPSAALIVSLVALFVALSDSSSAARIANVILGKTNRSTRTTGIAAPTRGPVLAVTNSGTGTAGSFTVKPNVQPFTVNSTTKVKKLNADLLDDFDSTSFWNIDGNAGTDPATNFIGTTDAQPLVVRTNNTEALRVDAKGNVGIGTTTPSAAISVVATSTTNAVDGRATNGIGVRGAADAGVGVFGVSTTGDGLAGSSTSGLGVSGSSAGGIGVFGTSPNGRGIVGILGPGSCDGTYAVGGCGGTIGIGVQGSSVVGAGVWGRSTNGQGVEGTLGGVDCFGAYAVAGCAGSAGSGVFGSTANGDGVTGQSPGGIGVLGNSGARGVVGTLNGGSCPGTYAVGACAGAAGDGVLAMINHPAGGSTAAAVHAINTGGGDIFLGVSGTTRVARIDGGGKGYFDGGTQSSGADYADSMRADSAAKLRPGDVLAIDPRKGNTVRLAHGPGSTLVAGVYSTKPAMLGVGSYRLGGSLRGRVPVALIGIVPTRVSVENGPVRVGDLLTTSSTPGYAMKAKPVLVNGVAVYPAGTILGKAMQPLASGKRLIQVLVTLR